MEYGRTVVFCAVLFWVTLFGPATWALAPSSDIAVRDLFRKELKSVATSPINAGVKQALLG